MYAGDDMEVRSGHYGLDPYLGFLNSVAIYATPLPKPTVGQPIAKNERKKFIAPKIDIPDNNKYEYDFLNQLKDAVKEVLSHQEIADIFWQDSVDKLSRLYDQYLEDFGRISRKRNNLDKKTFQV